jgi:hypothetical protein
MDNKVLEFPKAPKDIGVEAAKVAEVTGEEFSTIIASVSKKRYKIVPCSLGKIPQLVDYIKTFDAINEESSKNGVNQFDLLSNEQWRKAIAGIILMSIHNSHEMNEEKVFEEFTISDFPAIFKEALKLNDFLSQMGSIKM